MKTSSSLLRLATLAVLVLVIAACGGSKKSSKKKSSNRSTSTSTTTTPAPAGKDWAALERRVPNLARKDRALDLLDQAQSLLRKAKRMEDGPQKERMKKEAQQFYFDAGDLRDELEEAADDIDPQLWGRRFSSFSNSFSRKAKGLNRISFK